MSRQRNAADPNEIADQMVMRRYGLNEQQMRRFNFLKAFLKDEGGLTIEDFVSSTRGEEATTRYFSHAIDLCDKPFSTIIARTLIDDMKKLTNIPEGLAVEDIAEILKACHSEESTLAFEALQFYAEKHDLDYLALLYHVVENFVSVLRVYYGDDGWGDYEQRIAANFREADITHLDYWAHILYPHAETIIDDGS